MTKRKALSLLLALVMAVSVLSGCSGQSAAVKEADSLIAALGEITLESEEDLLEAEAAVSALSSTERGQLKYYADLKQARADFDELKADEVEALIKAIGSSITLDSEKAIQAARDAYSDLTKQAKSMVSNLKDLEKAEEMLKELKDAPVDESSTDQPEESSSQPEESSSQPEESSSKPEESSSKPEESSSQPEESSSQPEESSSKPEESSSQPEESSSKPEESSSQPEESSSKPEESSSESSSTAPASYTAADFDNAITSMRLDYSSFYNLDDVNKAIEIYNALDATEYGKITQEKEFLDRLYYMDLYFATVSNGYLAAAGIHYSLATEDQAKAALQLHALTFDIDENSGMTVYYSFTNLSSKTIDEIRFITGMNDEDGNPIRTTDSAGGGPFWMWELYDYDLEPGYYDDGTYGWGPIYAALNEPALGYNTLYAIEIYYTDGTSLMIVNSTLLSIYY